MTLHDLTINFIVSAGLALMAFTNVAIALQITASICSIVVGVITIYKFFNKQK